MQDTRPTNAEMAQLVGTLEEAGLVEVFTDDDGQETYRLTEEGVRVRHLLAMGAEASGDAVLEGLLSYHQG